MASNKSKTDENFDFQRAYIRFFNAEVELKVIGELVKNYRLQFNSESQDRRTEYQIPLANLLNLFSKNLNFDRC